MVFCMDIEVGSLLASNAAGRMPAGLQLEAGFEDEALSPTDETLPAVAMRHQETVLEEAKSSRVKLEASLLSL